MIWQVVVKSILLCIVWQTNSGLFDVFLSLSQIDGMLRFYALHTRVFHKCPVHSIFRFFVTLTKKGRNLLSCLFIFCLKNPYFSWKCQLIFFIFWWFWQKWNETNKNCSIQSQECDYFYSLFLVSLCPNNGNIFFRNTFVSKFCQVIILFPLDYFSFHHFQLREKRWCECESHQS